MYEDNMGKCIVKSIFYTIGFIVGIACKKTEICLLFAVLDIENTINMAVYELKDYIDKKV